MDCNYPDCFNCQLPDCTVNGRDINAMLKRRRWKADPETFRQKQRDYRASVRECLPHCDECNNCTLVKNGKGTGVTRLCITEMRLIEQKVSTSPHWCKRRLGKKEREHQRYLRRKEVVRDAKRTEAVQSNTELH